MTPPADPRTVLRALVEAVDAYSIGSDETARLALSTLNARPALAATLGRVWLDVETVRGLIDAGLDASVHDAGAGSGCHACEALAAAEAELRALENDTSTPG